jgi:hypothetical protein
MRNSQRAVVTVLGLAVALMVGVAMWLRLIAEPRPELSGERVSRTYDHTGFDGIEIAGQWQVALERGDAWRVTVEMPAELASDIEVELEGDSLSLDMARGGWFGGFGDDERLEATITMPALRRIALSGASNVSFSGFDGAALAIDLSGAGNVRGAASRFDALMLDLSGVGNADLADVTVTDADVDVSGAGNVKLRMAGGRLTGGVSGAANLEYYGPVSEQSVQQSGFVNVRRRD